MTTLADLTNTDFEILREAAAGKSINLDFQQVRNLLDVEPPLIEAKPIYGFQITKAGEEVALQHQ
ncbi:hypothetical protein [Silvimonas amylolytica]|uniref:Uncharacterized protein n=1 Tax=Silvimonas amylolytica TaxID=449663 RepID=A0ABQ2PIQ9_9NEIS|nr:hypothetical protein [Silvimonas amylolytica]GGP25225.1 hypothetical protein GCM10010971_10440 [Silvimonas amylolytica]